MALIEATNLKKTYTTGRNILTPALKGVSLSVETTDFVALAGPSGSGKSTLLHLLGALDSPTEGTIKFDGFDVTHLNATRLSGLRLHSIGFVFQAYNLINTLTALENVEYIMLLQGIGKHERRKRAEETLSRVGLSAYLNRFPNEMSGGQQQRVAVARAIAPHPKVIFADEPTANLDSSTAAALMDLLRELNNEHGTTIVVSTHDTMVMEKVKQVVRMKDGLIV